MDRSHPTLVPRSDVDGGVANCSCPSYGLHCSTSEPKHSVTFQFEGPRHSPSLGQDEASQHPSSSPFESAGHCSYHLGWETSWRYQWIALLLFYSNWQSIRHPRLVDPK